MTAARESLMNKARGALVGALVTSLVAGVGWTYGSVIQTRQDVAVQDVRLQMLEKGLDELRGDVKAIRRLLERANNPSNQPRRLLPSD